MPVRSLSSSVVKWPDKELVRQALKLWARAILATHSEVLGLGYFGSYAREDWGVGSDLDLIVILRGSSFPPERRALYLDKESLPVPADLLVYTLEEWRALSGSGSRFARMLVAEAVWLKKPRSV
jgi:predicted nucleotidyltransferase